MESDEARCVHKRTAQGVADTSSSDVEPLQYDVLPCRASKESMALATERSTSDAVIGCAGAVPAESLHMNLGPSSTSTSATSRRAPLQHHVAARVSAHRPVRCRRRLVAVHVLPATGDVEVLLHHATARQTTRMRQTQTGKRGQNATARLGR